MSTMKITFFPQRRDDRLELERRGDALIVNGVVHDFANVPEGGLRELQGADHLWMVEPVRRKEGEIEVSLILPVGAQASPEERFPTPVIVTADGPVTPPGSGAP